MPFIWIARLVQKVRHFSNGDNMWPISSCLKNAILPTISAKIELENKATVLSHQLNKELISSFNKTKGVMIGNWWDLFRSQEENDDAIRTLKIYIRILEKISKECSGFLNLSAGPLETPEQIDKRREICQAAQENFRLLRQSVETIQRPLRGKMNEIFEHDLYSPLLRNLWLVAAVAASVSVYLISGIILAIFTSIGFLIAWECLQSFLQQQRVHKYVACNTLYKELLSLNDQLGKTSKLDEFGVWSVYLTPQYPGDLGCFEQQHIDGVKKHVQEVDSEARKGIQQLLFQPA